MQEMLSREEAKAFLKGDFGIVMRDLAASYVAPFFWASKTAEDMIKFSNGMMSFLDCGEGPFAVTASHVYHGYLQDLKSQPACKFQLFDLDFVPEERLIDDSVALDIATFRISRQEVAQIDKSVLTGSQSSWPPAPPDRDCGVFFSGCTGSDRVVDWPKEINFGYFTALTVASRVSEDQIACQFEAEEEFDPFGYGPLPEDYDFGGISGSALLTLVNHKGVWSWRLGGIVYEASRSLRIIYARRPDCLLPDGRLKR